MTTSHLKGKQESSFSEEKEAKRLLFPVFHVMCDGSSNVVPPASCAGTLSQRRNKRVMSSCGRTKVFLLLFLQKKK
jgi:hypothetical protein